MAAAARCVSGEKEYVAEMMKDFLAQLEIGKRLNGETTD